MNMVDVDKMVEFWTTEVYKCLNLVSPWKTQKMKQKSYSLPKEIQTELFKRKVLNRKLQLNLQQGKIDLQSECEYKKL